MIVPWNNVVQGPNPRPQLPLLFLSPQGVLEQRCIQRSTEITEGQIFSAGLELLEQDPSVDLKYSPKHLKLSNKPRVSLP